MSNRQLGRYTMLETLGNGGFSKVKLGVDSMTGERVALKILKKEKLSSNSGIMKQVQRELAAMSKVQHENVLTLREVDWEACYTRRDGSQYEAIVVVLEVATGGELFDFLAFTGNFEESMARTYFHQLINGVGYVHSQGIVHRDLKPENLLLSDNFVLKLADFGFAHAFNEKDNIMYTECGTLSYMAPEIFARTGYEGTSADIWSCGVILFILIAGFPPFQKPAMTDWWFNKLATNRCNLFWDAHCRSAHFSEDLKDFLNRVLQPDPAKRIKVQEMIQHPWFQGPTIASAALTAELQRRKLTVDENKMRDRMAKSGDSDFLNDSGDVAMMRGHGEAARNPETEALPEFPPSMNVISLQPATKHVNQSIADASFGASAAPEAPEAVEISQALPRDLPASSPFSFTQFRSRAPLATLSQHISSALQMNNLEFESHPEDFRWRAALLTQSGRVEFSIQIYKTTESANHENPDWTVIFRKMAGDSAQFRMIYADSKEILKDFVVAQ